MKTILYNITFLITLLPAIAFGSDENYSNELDGRHTKEKKVSKKFNVAANALLKIDNSYGNIDISTWDQNVVSIEVFIKTNGNDEKKVQEKLDDINIEFNQTSAGVSAKTHFSKKEESSWWNLLFGNNSNNVNMEINYIIRAPERNNVELDNDYGNIYLDKLAGNAIINNDYGRIDIGELRGNNNQLNFDYSRNSHFGYINRAIINADYSEFTINDARSLDIRADYTTSYVRRAEIVQFNCDYGSIKVDKVKKLIGNGDYLSTKIGQVYQDMELEVDYGSVDIEKIMKGAGNIKINTDYAGVKIGYAGEHPFGFNLNSSYGNIKGLDNFEVNKQNQSSTKKSYSGYHLETNNNSNITVNSSYAGITFQQK